MKNNFKVNYDTKELTLHFEGEDFKWNLSDGDVGEFWHSFTTKKGVVKDINFHQEDENDIPTFAIYGVKKDKEGFLQINTDNEIIIKGTTVGDAKNYFGINPIFDEKHFYVDIPQEHTDEWLNTGTFKTREEAIKYAQEKFGADENGMVSLISRS
jgi:hypothetical protein